uniref:Uncharacterized protein n=1 Tax=Kryptolebias marmoratus TaxID=37003 RepID=A0A3Q3FV28_KRYMA
MLPPPRLPFTFSLRKRLEDESRSLPGKTIFDCKFKPDDPNLLATASFDGTIKIWDTNTLTAVSTSPGNEGVVYSLSWAPVSVKRCLVFFAAR